MNISPARLLAACSVALLAGCATPPPSDTDVHPDGLLRAFFQRPEDPRRYGLTVYESRYGPVFAGSKRLHANRLAAAPLVASRGAADPLIRVRGRGKRDITALVDTASRDSWATLEAATALEARPLGPHAYRRDAVHTREADTGFAAHASKLIIEEMHIENMVVYLRVPEVTLGPLARGNDHPRPDMTLGCDLLRQFAFVRFDYGARAIYFSTDRPYQGDPDALIATEPYRIVNGTPAIEAWLDDVFTNVILDTAGDFELAWDRDEGTLVRHFSLGDLVVRQAAVSDSRELGHGHPGIPRVGHRLLRRYAVILDNKQRRVIFERPAGFSPPVPERTAPGALPPKPRTFDWDDYVGR